jgi:hypothetical protein
MSAVFVQEVTNDVPCRESCDGPSTSVSTRSFVTQKVKIGTIPVYSQPTERTCQTDARLRRCARFEPVPNDTFPHSVSLSAKSMSP